MPFEVASGHEAKTLLVSSSSVSDPFNATLFFAPTTAAPAPNIRNVAVTIVFLIAKSPPVCLHGPVEIPWGEPTGGRVPKKVGGHPRRGAPPPARARSPNLISPGVVRGPAPF